METEVRQRVAAAAVKVIIAGVRITRTVLVVWKILSLLGLA